MTIGNRESLDPSLSLSRVSISPPILPLVSFPSETCTHYLRGRRMDQYVSCSRSPSHIYIISRCRSITNRTPFSFRETRCFSSKFQPLTAEGGKGLSNGSLRVVTSLANTSHVLVRLRASERHVSTALIESFNSWSLRFGRRSLKKNRDNYDSPEYTFFYKEHSKAPVSTRDDAELVQNFQKGSIEFRVFPLLRRTRNFIHFLLLFLVCL